MEVGKVYSYKQICELTGAEYKKGAGKTYQLEKFCETGFQRFFDFKKISRGKYEILEIYDNPLPIEDARHNGNNQVYTHYIELVLMNYLAKKGTHIETFTTRDLWELLGMVNEKYGKISNDKLVEMDQCITSFEINNFYLRSDKKLRQILLSALGNLRSRRLIDWQHQTVICKEKNNKEEWFVANDEEIKLILETEYEVLRQMGFEKMFQVISSFKTNEFYTSVENILYKKRRWKNYYRRYKLIFNSNNIKESIPDVEAGLNKALLNANIVIFLNNEAEKLYNEKLDEYNQKLESEILARGNVIEALYNFKYPANYVIAQKMLADELIDTKDYSTDAVKQLINIEASDQELEKLFS